MRPKRDVDNGSSGVSSGPVSFMHVFDAMTNVIKQGSYRRGANMAVLDVHHADIIEFIIAKSDHSVLNKFNISVAITNEFMAAVKNNDKFKLYNPRDTSVVDEVYASVIMDEIVESMWQSGEPGVIFIDVINKHNPLKSKIRGVNVCGEQPLEHGESCILGSINLSNFVVNNTVDYDRLGEVVDLGVRFLDSSIDKCVYPLGFIEEKTKQNRKIGLGVMGFADMLAYMDIPYDTDEGVAIGEKVMEFINTRAYKMSQLLANERGEFPNIANSSYRKPIRNACRTTVAPTGTISIIAGCSSGIEPIFSVVFERNILDGKRLVELNQAFYNKLKAKGLYYDGIEGDILTDGLSNVIADDDIIRLFRSAREIDYSWHLKMQAAFQKHCDSSISKTINMPNDVSMDDIRYTVMRGHDYGLKGVTVYRDGCRVNQPMSDGITTYDKRPSVVVGKTHKVETGCGSLYLTVNEHSNKIFEVFSHLGRSGGCAQAQLEAMSRLVALCLRSGITADDVIKQLRGIRCHSPGYDAGGTVFSCADAVAKVLGNYATEEIEVKNHNSGACSQCGGTMIMQEGCEICSVCNYSRCS